MRYVLAFVFAMLISTVSFANEQPLHPDNSTINPIHFLHGGRDHYIGTWYVPAFGQSAFCLVKENDNGDYVFVGRITPLSASEVERYGGTESYIQMHLDSWNTELAKTGESPSEFPKWEIGIHNWLYYDSGRLIFDNK